MIKAFDYETDNCYKVFLKKNWKKLFWIIEPPKLRSKTEVAIYRFSKYVLWKAFFITP